MADSTTRVPSEGVWRRRIAPSQTGPWRCHCARLIRVARHPPATPQPTTWAAESTI